MVFNDLITRAKRLGQLLKSIQHYIATKTFDNFISNEADLARFTKTKCRIDYLHYRAMKLSKKLEKQTEEEKQCTFCRHVMYGTNKSKNDSFGMANQLNAAITEMKGVFTAEFRALLLHEIPFFTELAKIVNDYFDFEVAGKCHAFLGLLHFAADAMKDTPLQDISYLSVELSWLLMWAGMEDALDDLGYSDLTTHISRVIDIISKYGEFVTTMIMANDALLLMMDIYQEYAKELLD